MRLILITVLLTLGSFSTFAKNIQPVENVGRILVQLPDVSSFSKVIQDEYRRGLQALTFRGKKIEAGVEYFVDAGSGCAKLQLSSNFVTADSICGTVIAGQLTTLEYVALHVEWDFTHLKTDVGPGATLYIADSEGFVIFPASVLDAQYIAKNLYLGKPGIYKSSFYITQTADIFDEKSFTVSSPQTINVTPKDIREEIIVNFQNGPEKFGLGHAQGSAYVIFRDNPFSEVGKTLLPNYKTYFGGGMGNVVNYARINPQLQNTHSLKFFPISQKELGLKAANWVLEIVVNETRWPLSFAKGQKQTVPIEIINVNDFQTGKTGLFTFARKHSNIWIPILTTVSEYGDLSANYLPTSRSILLLPGYDYRFEFFIKDDLGKLLKQDEVILDLK